MKSQTLKMLTGIMATIMLFGFYSCAKKTAAVGKTETTAPTSATETTTPIVITENKGQVEIKRDINSNYVISINLQELQEIKNRDQSSKTAYIVWMDADNQLTKKLGEINSNTGLLSDKSKASFDALSEFKPTKIFITSENSALIKTPGKNIIWSTNRF